VVRSHRLDSSVFNHGKQLELQLLRLPRLFRTRISSCLNHQHTIFQQTWLQR
jgi:hypothetical protein